MSLYEYRNVSVPISRRIELVLYHALAAKYGTPVPVRLDIAYSPIMDAHEVGVSVPGQVRRVLLTPLMTEEEWCEEVLFAAFLLLDEDEDEE